LELYDLANDIGEKINLVDKYPQVVERLKALAQTAREDIGDSLTKQVGKNCRPPGRVD
jgi:arylsulfatase